MAWITCLVVDTSQVIVLERNCRTSYLTFGFNERW